MKRTSREGEEEFKRGRGDYYFSAASLLQKGNKAVRELPSHWE